MEWVPFLPESTYCCQRENNNNSFTPFFSWWINHASWWPVQLLQPILQFECPDSMLIKLGYEGDCSISRLGVQWEYRFFLFPSQGNFRQRNTQGIFWQSFCLEVYMHAFFSVLFLSRSHTHYHVFMYMSQNHRITEM